ncbi:recombinase family protein [Actinokineospora sp. NBRC 105648]|uniref:recombinase family protein n=1 Tax=Actinokineospora sp. NBRC 105648 TaxID=3032206 RepID=UPI0024A4C4C6|nr:recombinase family protein [Actinokineospora sp. NBRC 105648]GLZ37611.1 recombinase [Actinokineospora sp. NBRC 105648]
MTAETSGNPWATLDELMGIEIAAHVTDDRIGALAFYGRCSTEDNQDPETSRGWQLGNAEKFVGPLGGRVVAEFFDIGQSRSVPWERREAASKLLAALKDPQRTWDALVVGEGTRCWFGNQFSLIAPRFAAYGVDLWVPELGGRFDPRNPSHKMLMSVLGGMSESERQHVQARVRAAMDAQVVNEGRHQGGRTPYGYLVVDAGPHPNPRKAAEGFRLRRLEVDEVAAGVVRRIYAEYVEGNGDRAIAAGLNRDGIPCPSALRPEQNRHRLADGWQGGTVRSILENPKYTGFAVFGRSAKHEMLADPDDVAAGHVTRFRKASPDRVVRSRTQAHPEIVSVETFTQAQLVRRSRGAGGMSGIARLERTRTTGKRTYLLRGLIRCAICERKMQGEAIRDGSYYRCIARTMAPGSPALAGHPKTVNLREDVVVPRLNEWIGTLFARDNVGHLVRSLLGSQDGHPDSQHEAVRKRLADAEGRLRRYQDAIAAGMEPAALVEAVNEAHAQRQTARAELANLPTTATIDEAEVYAMIDSLGDVSGVIGDARPASLAKLYADLRLRLRYDHTEKAIDVTASPRVVNESVRGGT